MQMSEEQEMLVEILRKVRGAPEGPVHAIDAADVKDLEEMLAACELTAANEKAPARERRELLEMEMDIRDILRFASRVPEEGAWIGQKAGRRVQKASENGRAA